MRYRLLGFLAGFGLVVATAWFLRESFAARQRVLSESEGALGTVEIQYTQDSATATWPALSVFFSQIEPDVDVIAACGSKADERAIRKAWRWPNKLATAVVGAEITGWSKDRFLVSVGSPATLLCPRKEPASLVTRNNDARVADAIAAYWPTRYRAQEQGLSFDAGDVLCNDEQAIFSDLLWKKNDCRTDLPEQVRKLTGMKPLWLKGVPEHHIGMFAAPLDSRTVVVGDPDLGQKLWTRDATKRFNQPLKDVTPFRTAIAQFEKAGYRVIRAPIVPLAPQVYVTYTNGVFEKRGNRKAVYMPIYGIKAMDDAGAAAYRSQGWEVRPIPVGKVFRFRGTIGCLVNVLGRR